MGVVVYGATSNVAWRFLARSASVASLAPEQHAAACKTVTCRGSMLCATTSLTANARRPASRLFATGSPVASVYPVTKNLLLAGAVCKNDRSFAASAGLMRARPLEKKTVVEDG